jgi:hypothetical protein
MEIIMQKFTFVVDIVTDSPVGIEPQAVRDTLLASVLRNRPRSRLPRLPRPRKSRPKSQRRRLDFLKSVV